MIEAAILARASAVGITAPGKCPRCLRLLMWDRFAAGLGLSCSDPQCEFGRWFDNAELESMGVRARSG